MKTAVVMMTVLAIVTPLLEIQVKMMVTAAPTDCPSVSLNETVHKSDGCMAAVIRQAIQLHETVEIAKVHLTLISTVFCRKDLWCHAPFQSQFYSRSEDCGPSISELAQLQGNREYIFCGRFLDDDYYEAGMTGKPLLNDRETRMKIREMYASVLHLKQPSMDVEGAWQSNVRVEPTVHYVREGHTVNLTCTYEFEEESSGLILAWNSSLLRKSDTHSIIRDRITEEAEYKSSVYVITNAALQDSGIYTCRAGIYRRLFEPSKLNISVIAQKTTYLTISCLHPNVTESMEEENLPIHWNVVFFAHPEPHFEWKRRGVLLRDSASTTTSRGQFRHYEMKVARQEAVVTLYLHHPRLDDNGAYTLEAFIPGTDVTSTTTLYLMIPGKPQNVTLRIQEGDKLKFTCRAEGYPRPTLTLLYSAADPDSDTAFRTTELAEERSPAEDNETSMVVRESHWIADDKEPGWYQCVAANELGQASSPVKLLDMRNGNGTVPPLIRNLQKTAHENLTLTCPADDTPHLKVTWKKDGVILPESDRFTIRNNSQLAIQNLLSEDRGTYICQVANKIILSFVVEVEDQPESSQWVTAIIIVVVVVIAVVLVALVGFFGRKLYLKRTLREPFQEMHDC